MAAYLIAAVKPCEARIFEKRDRSPGDEWHFIDRRADLTVDLVERLRPRYAFFPTWHWIVPRAILERVECVCFHMTDLPYGRGGSPLQNLILRGHEATKLTALRMSAEMDAGPVYMKRPLSLEGRAQDVYERAAELIFDMMDEIVEGEPVPVPQVGEATEFKRRDPTQSLLPNAGTIGELHAFIRMLDAENYPAAFVQHGDWRLEFSHAETDGESVRARVTFTRRDDSAPRPK